MPSQEHPAEQRVASFAAALTSRVDMMAAMMRPDDRQLFHQRLSEPKAMQFWRKHRYDEMGQQVLSTWQPDQVLDLDRRLMQQTEADGFAGGDLNGPTY